MEQHSALTKKKRAVSVEQVSIFICSDNTVISFFEHSAADIEVPILTRLKSENTILRSSCDASMLVQAIIDAVIDLAIPVVAAYEDVMGALELEVLRDPEIGHSQSLYILTSELTILKNTIQPLLSLRFPTCRASLLRCLFTFHLPLSLCHFLRIKPALNATIVATMSGVAMIQKKASECSLTPVKRGKFMPK